MPPISRSNANRTHMQDSYRNLKARQNRVTLPEADQEVHQTSAEVAAADDFDIAQMTDPSRLVPTNHSSLPDVSDVFNSFEAPTENRTFKTEPMDDEEWRAEQERRKQEAIEKKQREKEDRERARAEKLAAKQAATQAMSGDHSSGRSHRSSVAPRTRQQSVVDLTDDTEDVVLSPQSQSQIRAPQQSINTIPPHQPRPLTAGQVQIMDQLEIPPHMLQQAREVYHNEQILVPGNVRRWIDLKTFAAQRPNNSISPRVILIAQAHAFQLAPLPTVVPHHATAQNAAHIYQMPAYGAMQSAPARSVMSQGLEATGQAALPSIRQIKIEAEEQAVYQQVPIAFQAGAPRPSTYEPQNIAGSANAPAQRGTHSVNQQHVQPIPVPSTTPPAVSGAQIFQFVQPIELMAGILPPDTPEGHPHLVNIWEQALLDLPIDQHDHLKLPDVVVSILAKYDLESGSAIKPFLDLEKHNHYFFLFKARDTHTHSWSIEREGNIVSVGIENWKRSRSDEGPSAGQFNVSFVFRIVPTMPASLDPLHVKRAPEQQAEAEIPDEDEEPERVSPEDTQPKIPGRWILHNLCIIPSTPDLFTYLYHTPASRGADSHTLISHPNQSHLMAQSDLSILARYMQQTFCTSKVMDTEIQIAYGRKVKYDSQLGRIRQVYDYALKGAKTQKLKRERGEYNRPKNQRPGAASGSGDHPGAGESKGYLAGVRRGASVGAGEGGALDGETRVDTNSLRGDLRDFVIGDQEQGERARKRQRVGRAGVGEDSGSNFSDASDGD